MVPHNFKNLTGQSFGRLLVLEEVGRSKDKHVLWECYCDCGNEVVVRGTHLRSGNTRSCGCYKRKMTSETKRIDLTGKRFGRLLVLEFDSTRNSKTYWKCICDCGNIKIVRSSDLRVGKSKSCGCYRKERLSDMMKGRTGKNNPRYNSNITDEERQIGRFFAEYKEWRTVVFERDNYTCKGCGSRGCRLAAHHLESYRDNPELRTSPENGITLCDRCHKDFHHQYGRGNNTRKQFEEFLLLKKN